MKLLFFGDIVGRVGRRALTARLAELKESKQADFVIVNGENAAGGFGIDLGTAKEMFAAGADLLTSGNHIWQKKEIYRFLDEQSEKLIRPANFPEGAPGKGCVHRQLADDVRLSVINIQGRVFIPDLVDCPFKTVDRILEEECQDSDIIFVDFHAEATSEKVAMGFHLDGRVHAVVGTHTHVQTADERLLPQGTAFICDVGMCGPINSVIGAKADLIVERFKTARPVKFETAKGPAVLNAVVIDIDETTMTTRGIERICEYLD
ncbi:UNVERIFIED_CONTAM: hypothetical protein GTU68_000981 [Idotea baltica]|nr:hypothetical protein [Idotea baltica]